MNPIIYGLALTREITSLPDSLGRVRVSERDANVPIPPHTYCDTLTRSNVATASGGCFPASTRRQNTHLVELLPEYEEYRVQELDNANDAVVVRQRQNPQRSLVFQENIDSLTDEVVMASDVREGRELAEKVRVRAHQCEVIQPDEIRESKRFAVSHQTRQDDFH